MVLMRNLFHDLTPVRCANHEVTPLDFRKEAIVVPASPSEPPAAGVEGPAGYHDEADPSGQFIQRSAFRSEHALFIAAEPATRLPPRVAQASAPRTWHQRPSSSLDHRGEERIDADLVRQREVCEDKRGPDFFRKRGEVPANHAVRMRALRRRHRGDARPHQASQPRFRRARDVGACVVSQQETRRSASPAGNGMTGTSA